MKLEIRNLTKDYGTVVGLNEFSVTLEPGIYGILGPNGSGKSTLMNLLTDNISRTKGEILLDGTDILKLGAMYRSCIGYMPQQQGFYPGFSALTFMIYMAKLKGIRGREVRKQSIELLEKVNLSDVKDQALSGFSGGMRQRVLLAQSLLGNPDILLLDEPTAGLDPKERIRIRNLISSLSENKIILLATHIVSDIESIADSVLVLKKGVLLSKGTPDELEASIEGKVLEYPLSAEAHILGRYKVGNLFRRDSVSWVRLIGDSLPEGGIRPDHLNLEDVYLYYLEDDNIEKA